MSNNDRFVDLKSRTRWDLNFIESYQAYSRKEHEFENIFATFSYHPLLSEKIKNEVEWVTFKNLIVNDFSKLEYPPCHLYVEREEVTAIWFVPNELLFYELGQEEQQLVINNMKKQLIGLSLCKLEEIFASAGGRDISEELYLEEYYRKNQFIKVLLSNAEFAKGEQ